MIGLFYQLPRLLVMLSFGNLQMWLYAVLMKVQTVPSSSLKDYI
jgi:hypothetical protein